ncbi:TPA: hypothetical protein R0840_001542 [Campylobacter jejuni]|nr:hypothetical protein [Campylobacter jejuni]
MNTSLNEEQKKNIENKFLEFQRIWTLEKVESMTLEEYASIKKIIKIGMILLFG